MTGVTTTPDVSRAEIEAFARQTTEIGSELSAFTRYAGLGFDPDTGDLVDWSGEWRARDVEDMLDRDGIARAGEQALTLPLRGAPLAVKPADGDKGEAELVNDTLANLADPVEDLIGQAAQAQIYRMTFLEKLWTVRDGQLTYDALAWRPPDSCAPLRDPATGRLTGFKQQMTWWGGRASGSRTPGSWVTIPAAKACVFVHGKARNPVRGVSELQTAYRCYQDKQKIRFLWTVFLKGASIQRVIAETESGREAAVAAELAKLSAGGVAAVSGISNLHILNATDSGAFFKEALAYLDNEMLSSILAGFLGLTGGAMAGRGSFALSKDQSDFFTQAQDATAREIAADVRTQIIRPLLVVNFGPQAAIPKVTLGPVVRATAQEQMDFLKGMVAAPSGPTLPAEFFDQLVVQVASHLDMDTDTIAAALKAAMDKTSATLPADGVTTPAAAAASGAIGAASDIVQRALEGLQPVA